MNRRRCEILFSDRKTSLSKPGLRLERSQSCRSPSTSSERVQGKHRTRPSPSSSSAPRDLTSFRHRVCLSSPYHGTAPRFGRELDVLGPTGGPASLPSIRGAVVACSFSFSSSSPYVVVSVGRSCCHCPSSFPAEGGAKSKSQTFPQNIV